MNQKDMHRLLMIAGASLCVLAGLSTVGLLVACALAWSWGMLFTSLLLGMVTVGLAFATNHYGMQVSDTRPVFENAAEREVLSPSQQKTLRKARGDVVMERALIEVEQEKQNIAFRQIEAANDDERPPHKTRWSEQDEAERRERERRMLERGR